MFKQKVRSFGGKKGGSRWENVKNAQKYKKS